MKKKFIGKKKIIANIYRIQAYDSIMCRYKNDKNTKMFSITKKMKKLYCIICGKYRKSEKPKISYILEKTLVLSIIWSKCENEEEKVFEEEK